MKDKRCTKCNIVKNISDFAKNTDWKGRPVPRSMCKSCNNMIQNSRSPSEFIEVKSKICASCKLEKDTSEFSKLYKSKDRLQSKCKSCSNDYKFKKYHKNKELYGEEFLKENAKRVREYYTSNPKKAKAIQLKCNFGLDISEFDKMMEEQNGLCSICHKPETLKHQSGITRKLAVDHCHKTGKIRGLLCNRCNTSLGKFEDSIELLTNAIEYLKRNNDVET